jgi:hypothetical protein
VGNPCRTSEASTDFAAPAPLRFERRQHDRWPACGVATASRAGGEHFGEMEKMRLLDCSHEGLGAICARPLEPGAIVCVSFQAPGHLAGRGVVLRCLPCGDGYRVAIRFEASLAA